MILTNIPDKIHNLHGYDDIISTDHKLISFDLDLRVPKKPDIKRSVYNFKRADWSNLNNSLQNTSWDQCFVPNDVDASLSNWCAVFLTVVNQHVPKSKTRNIHDHPWIDKELLSLIKRKNMQRLKANRSGCVHDAQKFKDLRRLTKQLISQKKKEYATKLRDSVTENPKRFWSFVKSSRSVKITANFLRDNQSFITDSRDKANLLNSFFHSVFSPAQATITTSNLPLSSDTALSNIQLTENEVFKALDGLDPSKACGPDGIPGKLLKMTANIIAPSLCYIYNLSLSQGVVPACWKLANVTPVFKKDDPTLASNYRPISLLSIISKTFERCVYNHCYPHLSPRFYHLQHGFLRGKFTVTQLLHVYQEILDHLAGGKEVDAIHLDLSKAFDRVQHHMLLNKLEQYGISGSLLQWFRSYLSDRYQRVALDGTLSEWLPVTSGVPQGSILGPLLFLVYINDMPEYVGQGSSIALFADDSKLYRPINSASHHLLQSDLSGLHNWSNDWGMTFNPSKCKVMHMSRKKVCSSASLQYHLNDKPLESVTHISALGVIVSKDLSWANHIEDICTKANKTLGLIKRVCARDVVDANTRKLLYCAVVRPKLEYASCVWSPYSAKQRKLIENVQRRQSNEIHFELPSS